MDAVTYRPIGVIHSPFHGPQGTPIQPSAAQSVAGTAELAPEYAAALQDLEGFSHVILLYHCHRAQPAKLVVTPFLDGRTHGVFSTRAPSRPNPIGLSVVALVRVEGCTLHLSGVDILDGTPLLDVKPYVPAFDAPTGAVRCGWLAENVARLGQVRDDGRFAQGGSE